MVQGYWCCSCATHPVSTHRILRWNHISRMTACRSCQHAACIGCYFDDIVPSCSSPIIRLRSGSNIEREVADEGLREWVRRMRGRNRVYGDGNGDRIGVGVSAAVEGNGVLERMEVYWGSGDGIVGGQETGLPEDKRRVG